MMEITIWIENGVVEVIEGREVVLKAKYEQLEDDDIRCFIIGHLMEGLRECYYANKYAKHEGFNKGETVREP